MKKRILPFLCVALLLAAWLRPACAHAAEVPESADLTLYYEKDGAAFDGLNIGIYRVAQALPDGAYALIEPFSSYPINIHGITMQEQWNRVAQTLCSYIVANGVAADREGLTDEDGAVHFVGLETGLYFVREAAAERLDGTYLFNQFMIYVPTPQPDGSYDDQVQAKPKCVGFTPKTKYTVTKLWQDAGKQSERPDEVAVEIYRDGALQETQSLSADNNWSYSWYVPAESYSQWTVAERTALNRYQVTVQQSGSTFTLINTDRTDVPPPGTGDSFSPLPWIAAACLSGMLLLALGLRRERSNG